MKSLITKLNDENWVNSTNEIEVSLKRELQNGLVKEYRNSFDP